MHGLRAQGIIGVEIADGAGGTVVNEAVNSRDNLADALGRRGGDAGALCFAIGSCIVAAGEGDIAGGACGGNEGSAKACALGCRYGREEAVGEGDGAIRVLAEEAAIVRGFGEGKTALEGAVVEREYTFVKPD